jgi:hypothetical protein
LLRFLKKNNSRAEERNAEGAEKGSAEAAERAAAFGRNKSVAGRAGWGSFDWVRLAPDFAPHDTTP